MSPLRTVLLLLLAACGGTDPGQVNGGNGNGGGPSEPDGPVRNYECGDTPPEDTVYVGFDQFYQPRYDRTKVVVCAGGEAHVFTGAAQVWVAPGGKLLLQGAGGTVWAQRNATVTVAGLGNLIFHEGSANDIAMFDPAETESCESITFDMSGC